jgi:hypothetical protein
MHLLLKGMLNGERFSIDCAAILKRHVDLDATHIVFENCCWSLVTIALHRKHSLLHRHHQILHDVILPLGRVLAHVEGQNLLAARL